MRNTTRAVLVSVVGLAVGCGSGGASSYILGSTVAASSFEKSARADVSGQENAFEGKLGSGATFTFPAIQGVGYNFSVKTKTNGDELVIDVFSKDGTVLKSKDVKAPGGFLYSHTEKTQHVLVLLRPSNPANTSFEVTECKVTGIGSYSQTSLSVNLIVAGDDFSGFGVLNDLKGATDRSDFTKAVMTKVNALLGPTGIVVAFEGFSMTSAQIKATHPTLIDEKNRAIAQAGETVNPQGFAEVNTLDLDRYGAFGFPATDPVKTRAMGLDVFVINHFSTEGVVGLSPRPGVSLKGNGPGTAVGIGAFLKSGGKLYARTIDDIATVMTHEIGHFLGLMHTTTFTPTPNAPTKTIDDGLADTPRCTVTTDVNKDGVVGIGDGCPDENNIMFWQAGRQTDLSGKQGLVLKTTLSSMEH